MGMLRLTRTHTDTQTDTQPLPPHMYLAQWPIADGFAVGEVHEGRAVAPVRFSSLCGKGGNATVDDPVVVENVWGHVFRLGAQEELFIGPGWAIPASPTPTPAAIHIWCMDATA